MTVDCSVEVYEDIAGYEGRYQISNWGNVKSLRHTITVDTPYRVSKKGKIIPVRRSTKEIEERILVPENLSSGYQRVSLYNEDGSRTKPRIHQLVANAFIENPDSKNKKEIDHIDGNKHNNRADNLRWCTHEENMRYAQERLGPWNSQKQKVVCLDTTEEFDSIADAARWASGDDSVKSNSLRSAMANEKAYYGHVFVRVEDLNSISDVDAYVQKLQAEYRNNTSSEEKAIVGKRKRNWKSSRQAKPKKFKLSLNLS